MAAYGMDASTTETRIDSDRGALASVVDVTSAFDTILIGDSHPAVATFVFGMPAGHVADRFLAPALVVQREPAPNDEGDNEPMSWTKASRPPEPLTDHGSAGQVTDGAAVGPRLLE